jgi:hypothetical protein
MYFIYLDLNLFIGIWLYLLRSVFICFQACPEVPTLNCLFNYFLHVKNYFLHVFYLFNYVCILFIEIWIYLLEFEFIYWDLYLFVFKPALKYSPWTVYLIISCM